MAMYLDLSYSLSHGRDRTLSTAAPRAPSTTCCKPLPTIPAERRAAKYLEFSPTRPPEGNLIHLLDSQGRRIYPRNPDPADFSWPLFSDFNRPYRDAVHEGRHFRVFVEPVQVSGEKYFILVAGQLEDNLRAPGTILYGLAGEHPGGPGYLRFGGIFCQPPCASPHRPAYHGGTLDHHRKSFGAFASLLPPATNCIVSRKPATKCWHAWKASVGRIQRFTADASHELRSPISFMRTVAEVALGNPAADRESRESFEEVLKEATAASALLDDMLALARADSGRYQLRFEPIDLAEVIEDLRARALPLAQAKGQTLVVHRQVSARISGDRASLHRLVWTLVENAIKYTPSGGRVELSIDAAGKETTLEVRDTGIGIPAALLPRVFDRFFRADPARTQVDGAGLGLAIAKWIADMHHASIDVESAEGHGTTFRVVFRAVG